MQTDVIEAMGIDEGGSLCLKPATATFPTAIVSRWRFIGMPSVRAFSSPKPREWPYAACFRQIKDAAREAGCNRKLDPTAPWTGVDPELRKAFVSGD